MELKKLLNGEILQVDFLYGLFLYFSLGLIPLLIIFYFYLSSRFNYWKRKGIDYIKPSFPFGNLGDVMMGRISLTDLLIEQYRQFEGKAFFGMFNFTTPVLVLRDTSLIEKILMTDFANFCDRGDSSLAPRDDPFNHYVGNLSGDTWRQVRHKINGAFSNNKLKRMTELISSCTDYMLSQVDETVCKKGPVLLDCIGFTFSLQVIAKCAFGIECDEYGFREFVLQVKKQFLGMKIVHMIILFHIYTPRLIRFLYLVPPVDRIVQYFKNLTLETIRVRQQSQIKRNDFLQMLLDLKEEEVKECNGETKTTNVNTIMNQTRKDSQENVYSTAERKLLITENVVISQVFMFMSLGMESTAISVTFIFIDLAANLDVQNHVHEEIDSVVARYGELNYEAIQQLTYLDSVIQESMRLNPGFPYLTRVCQSPYRLPGTELTLDRGTVVLVPSCAVHLDPHNYPDPGVFNPDRFADNNYKPSPAYLPFGAGPRMCLAMKLVILELKLAVAKVMHKYSIKFSSKTELPPRYAPIFMPKLLNGAWADFQLRQPQSA